MAVLHDPLERILLPNGVLLVVYPTAVRVVTPADSRLTSVFETNERGEPEMSHAIQW